MGSVSFAITKGRSPSDLLFERVIGIPECSAVVIGPRALLTAAHCVGDFTPGSLQQINVGRRSSKEFVHFSRSIIHDNYDPKTKIFDVALILTKEAVGKFNVKLPVATEADFQAGTKMYALGLGTQELRKGSGPMDPNNSLSQADMIFSEIREFALFLLPTVPRQSACYGDSGGGVFVERAGGPALAGIISQISDECRFPDRKIFAHPVAPLLAWIKTYTTDLDFE